MEIELNKQRETDRRTDGEKVLSEFKTMFEADWERDGRLRSAMQNDNVSIKLPDSEGLDSERIYSLETIRKICLKYRLRFLGTELFRGEIPQSALTQIKQTENQLNIGLESFMIVAPAKMFRLEDANRDPLLFAPLSDGRFYLLARWGNDLSWHRALMAWPVKSPLHLAIVVFVVAAIVSLLLPTQWLTSRPLGYFNFFRVLSFGINFTIIGGLVSYFWFVLYQKFSWHAWNCRTFN